MFSIYSFSNTTVGNEYSFYDLKVIEGTTEITETTETSVGEDITSNEHPFDLDSYSYCLIKMQGYL